MVLRDQDISVILVDQDDAVVGYGDKLDVHRKGLLHRAFSIFIFNDRGELLIQRRADDKYHASGLWANTCCGHPFPGELVESAAARRLCEELGFDCKLDLLTHIYYKANLDNGMIEHEYVHVFKGDYNGALIRYDPNEVKEIGWIEIEYLRKDVTNNPQKYAPWFAHYVEKCADQIFSPLLQEDVA
jgi:isopentenyl-diphosphate delta-isomerase